MRSWQSYLINTVLRLTFKRQKPGSIPLQRQREDFEQMMRRQFRPLPGVNHRADTVDGVPCDWVDLDDQQAQGTVLYFHGGGYVLGSPVAYRDLTGRIAAAARCRVLAPDYRLAPEHAYPAAVDDALKCYRWLLANGTPTSSIVIAGDSAGGGLTLATLVALKQAGDPLPAGAVCLSPWTDLAGTGVSMSGNAAADPMLTAAALAGMARTYASGQDLTDPLISPFYADLSGLPPTCLFVGSTEILRDDAERVVARIRESGGDAVLKVQEKMPHVWPMFAARLPEGRETIAEIGRFVQRRVNSEGRAA